VTVRPDAIFSRMACICRTFAELRGPEVRATLDEALPGVRVEASVRTSGRTGVEMEALTAVAVALLTVYDMVKATGHDLEIGEIGLVEKTGGRSGDWRRTP